MDMMKKTLAESLPGLGLTLDDAIQDQLCAFGHAMVKQNEVMNLTGITEDDQVAKLHLLDSLSILAVKDLSGKRMDHARWLLDNTKLTVEQISVAVGYTDFSTFYRAFCKAHGHAPSAFRKEDQLFDKM